MSAVDMHILKLLDDIQTSAERIRVMLAQETCESFLSPSAMTVQDAVARRFTIIGEASAALLKKYPEFADTYPGIPLHLARGMRNAIVHDYDGIDWKIIWDTVHNGIPQLVKAIEEFRRLET